MANDAEVVFHLFPNFPPEIRRLIWSFSLRQTEGRLEPTLFVYREKLWRFREIAASDPRYNSQNPEENHRLEFEHTKLDPVELHIHLARVSHEANEVVMEWAKKNNVGIAKSEVPGPPSTLFLQRFNPQRDILYLPTCEVEPSYFSPPQNKFADRRLATDIEPECQVRFAAVPQTSLADWRTRHDLFYYIAERFPKLKRLFIISGLADERGHEIGYHKKRWRVRKRIEVEWFPKNIHSCILEHLKDHIAEMWDYHDHEEGEEPFGFYCRIIRVTSSTNRRQGVRINSVKRLWGPK